MGARASLQAPGGKPSTEPVRAPERAEEGGDMRPVCVPVSKKMRPKCVLWSYWEEVPGGRNTL